MRPWPERADVVALALALQPPLLMLGVIALAALWAAGLRRLEARAQAGLLSPYVPAAGALAATAGAVALLWPYFAPGAYGDAMGFASKPHVPAAAALVGSALAGRSLAARNTALALASVAFLAAAAGPTALSANLIGLVPSFFVERALGRSRPRLAVWLQVGLVLASFALLCSIRFTQPLESLTGWGIYAFAALRHMSFVRCARAAPDETFPRFADWLLYLLFFPTCVGAIEVFDEFRERNLRRAEPTDLWHAFARVSLGTLQLSVAIVLDASIDAVFAAQGFLATWREILLLFARSALAVTGTWALLEGSALFLGVRTRTNFKGVLLATSPAEFWHAWRITMTRWMIQNVYVPLGGNRSHRARNAAVAFLVSVVWHFAGTAFFLGERFLWASLVPIAFWGVLSYGGVVAHAVVRAYHPPVERPLAAAACVRTLKIGATWIYGSFSVTLLEISLGDPARFAVFLRKIVGL